MNIPQLNNLSVAELVREIENSDNALARALLAHVDALTEELDDVKSALSELENGPMCRDDDHCDFEHYKTFFDDAREIIGVDGPWLETYEVADRMRDELHAQFD